MTLSQLRRLLTCRVCWQYIILSVFRAVERKSDIVVTEPLEVPAAASQTDEDVAGVERRFHSSFKQIIYQFLIHTVDLKRGNLIDRLVTNHVLSHGERQRIKDQKRTSVRVNSLLMTLRGKTSDEFDSFLRTLSETFQQSVAVVVRQAVHTVGLAGQNPLHISGEIVYLIFTL